LAKGKFKLGKSDRLFHIFNNVFLGFCFIIIIFPIMNIVSESLSSPNAVMTGKVLFWPVQPTIKAYEKIIINPALLQGYGNSIFYTVVGTLINIVLTIMAAYPLSRKDFYGRKIIISIFVFTMLFGGGLIPTYLLIKDLGMINSRWVMVIPNALSVWNVMIARTFFQNTIPDELCEAAELDGVDDIKMLLLIVLPVSGPIIAVLVLFYAVGHWNSYFDGLIYLKANNLLPLQVVLRNILTSSQILDSMTNLPSAEQSAALELAETLKYSIIVFASLPVLILYPFVQKHFTKGIMIGSLKG
jgi:ABC-type glycerol-3-phosphate transport system permease component